VVYQDLKKYDGRTQIQTPHDSEARYSKKKRHSEWVGDKVQVTETEDDGYVSGPNLANSREQNIDFIGPLPPVVTPQDRIPNGFSQVYFQVDPIGQIVTCPQGHTAGNPTLTGNALSFRFPKNLCASCVLRPRCCTGKAGRTIRISSHYKIVQAARSRQKTEIFKKDYHKHRSGVEGSLSALVRGNGMRVGRYIGQRKRNLQAVFTGCAANLKRTAYWLAGERPQVRHKSWTLNAS